MAFFRARRTSCSGSSPIKTAMPSTSPNSRRPDKPSRQRSKTVSSPSGPEPPLSAGPAQEAGKKLHSARTRPTLGQGKPYPGLDDSKTRGTRVPPVEGHSDPRREQTAERSPEPVDVDMEQEWRRLAETKAKIEEEVRERTEFLRLVRNQRARVAEQGENLRRSATPEKRPSTPNSPFTSPTLETPPPLRPPSPSPARKACQEAYARMSPLMQHLLRERFHGYRIRPKDTQREREERREWEKYQKRPQQRPSSTGSSRTMHPGEEKERVAKDQERVTKDQERLAKDQERLAKDQERLAKDQDRHRRLKEIQSEERRFDKLWRDREQREIIEAWETYESRWTFLASSPPSVVRLHDLPWPVTSVFFLKPSSVPGVKKSLARFLSSEAVSSFVFSEYHSAGSSKKQRLHKALFRYHSDRFEGLWLEKVPETDGERELVRDAVGIVTRILVKLLKEEQ